MPENRRWPGLRLPEAGSHVRFVAALGLILSSMFAVGLLLENVVQQSFHKSYLALLNNMSDQGKGLVDSFVESQFRLLELYSRVPSVRQGTFTDIPAWLAEDATTPIIPKHLSIIDSRGRGTSSTGVIFRANDRKYFQGALALGRAIEGPIVSRIDGNKVVVLATMLPLFDRPAGVLSGALDLNQLRQLLVQIRGPANAGFSITFHEDASVLEANRAESVHDSESLQVTKTLNSINATLTVQVRLPDFMKPIRGVLWGAELLALVIAGLVWWMFFRGLVVRRNLFLEQKGIISALEWANEKIEELAYLDPVTDLPNRNMVVSRLSEAIERKTACRIIIVEIRDFALLSATHGLHIADKILRETSQRLKDVIPWGDGVFLGRIAETEFLVVIPDSQYRLGYIQELLELFGTPVATDSLQLHVAIQIGVCSLKEAGSIPDEVIRRTQSTLALARDKGPNQWAELVPEVIEQQTKRTRLQTAMPGAWERGEFEVHYQPQVSLKDHQVQGYEALLRWNSPELGKVNPAEFIPLAEESGFIVPLGQWVLLQGIRFALALQRKGGHGVVSVNVSPVQLLDRRFLDQVSAMIRASGLDPSMIGLEFTESLLIRGVDQILPLLEQLRATGVKLSLDDFGTGFSSLTSIKELPIDVLKLDKAFIDDLESDPKALNIARCLVDLAHQIGLSVVAEGVETPSQHDLLHALGCDSVQGFLTGSAKPDFAYVDVPVRHERDADEDQ